MINQLELKEKINRAVRQGDKFLFVINYEMDESIFILNPESNTEILWRVTNASNFESQEGVSQPTIEPSYILKSEYEDKFKTLYKGLYNGNSFLANLTVKTPLKGRLSLRDIALTARSRYLLYIPNRFVCFSPESFVRIDSNNTIFSYPMKGTIDAKVENAKEVLQNDYKERAEHCTIVDLIRSDLSRIATDVNVDSFGYIDEIATSKSVILQMSSKIRGTILPEYRDNYGDMFFELLPAGSISGAPKPTTVKLIEEAEGERRGFYCGVFGYYDGRELDSAVMIRYIEKEGDQFYYRSGGGITINSNLDMEYDEVNAKIYTTK